MEQSSTHPFSSEDSVSLNYNPHKDEFKDIEEFSVIFHSLDNLFEIDDSIAKKVVEFAKSYSDTGN